MQVIIMILKLPDVLAPFISWLNSVGGPVLSSVFSFLAPGGICITHGTTPRRNHLNLRSFFTAPRSSLAVSSFSTKSRRSTSPSAWSSSSPVAKGQLRPLNPLKPLGPGLGCFSPLMDREFPARLSIVERRLLLLRTPRTYPTV